MKRVHTNRIPHWLAARSRLKVAFVSTYPPRRCGIATFTHDLRAALAQVAPDLDTTVCAIDRDGLGYEAVSWVVRQHEYSDYTVAADQIAAAGVDLVVIEHEFGIFGGSDGLWITLLAGRLTDLRIPYLVTLHTVPSQPTAGQLSALRMLCRDAAAVTVFIRTARLLVLNSGLIDADRITIMPHGSPEILHPDSAHLAPQRIRPEVAGLLADARDARILSTFGLISPGKGLEVAIAAVAELAADHPDLRYIIAGVTHPEIVHRFGEEYRNKLTMQVAELGAERHVRFLNSFLTDAEIAALLHKTEVFLTPYHSREQISSGALTFALAAGCPVVSTSYPYARDMLSSGAGRTVEPGDPRAFTAALRTMLTEPERLQAAKAAAQQIGSTLSWPSVARRLAVLIRNTAQTTRTVKDGSQQPIP